MYPLSQNYQYSEMDSVLRLFNGFTIILKYKVEIPKGCFIKKTPKTSERHYKSGSISISTDNFEIGQIKIDRKLIFKKGKYLHYSKDTFIELIKMFQRSHTEKVVMNCRS